MNWRRLLAKANRNTELMLNFEHARRAAYPPVAVIDSQSAKAPNAGAWGYDAGKKIVGRKRHIRRENEWLRLQRDSE